MIHDLDDTLKKLLVRKGGPQFGEVDIKFEMPSPQWSAAISRPTVNLYLYDVRENLELRSNDLYVARNEDGTGTQQRAPARVDLSYMISVWTQDISDEHQLLGQILGTLLRYPILPDDVLMGSMLTQPLPLRAWIAQPERMPSPWDFWGPVEHRMKSGLCYVITTSLELHGAEQVLFPTQRVLNVETEVPRRRRSDSV